MEKIIAAFIVLGAAYTLVRLFRKQTSGAGGCACGGRCGNCPSLEKEHKIVQKCADSKKRRQTNFFKVLLKGDVTKQI